MTMREQIRDGLIAEFSLGAELAEALAQDEMAVRNVVRAEVLIMVRRALIGTTDGGEVDAAFEIPAGEIARILGELQGPGVASVAPHGCQHCGRPLPSDRVAYCTRACRLADDDHGPNGDDQ